ncbi:flagellar basal body rod protein FlgB [[Clostridium] fimetarium]|uniref:Flagellar basal body rod protein FlgB n=1 Tax=[Clostridium] fimetarium TaxID=99656 RepID=A0A1I0N0Z9_9FIRM|nr:flagellar basal body rod protein FlgB [[Clostridium] fimetarium]SEV94589.1 flagellar basal-body rod protein FlgB [[Clostridium] fimetarium]
MFSSGAFGYIDVLNSATNSSWLRNEVISSNIANVDTPNYKRKDVSFATYLNSALGGTDNTTSTLTQRVKSVDLSNVNSNVYTDNSNLSYRSDGNNVDIETENVELASNQIMYNALIDSMSNEFSRMKSVLN